MKMAVGAEANPAYLDPRSHPPEFSAAAREVVHRPCFVLKRYVWASEAEPHFQSVSYSRSSVFSSEVEPGWSPLRLVTDGRWILSTKAVVVAWIETVIPEGCFYVWVTWEIGILLCMVIAHVEREDSCKGMGYRKSWA